AAVAVYFLWDDHEPKLRPSFLLAEILPQGVAIDLNRLEDRFVPIFRPDAPAEHVAIDVDGRKGLHGPGNPERGLKTRPHSLVLFSAGLGRCNGRRYRLDPRLVATNSFGRANDADAHARRIPVRGGRAAQNQTVLWVLGLLIEPNAKHRFVDVRSLPIRHSSSPSS